jgi:hypothetical protein
MGQHKNLSRKPLTTRWILCTKWVQEVPKPNNSKEYDKIFFWTPIGTYEVVVRKGKKSGIPFSYSSESEATEELKEIIDLKPQLASGLIFVALEVKYVPDSIKAYKQDWFDKFVIKEVALEFKESKILDKMVGDK